MTPNEKRVLDFIGVQINAEGYPPSYRQIADHLGVKSVANIDRIVRSLERQMRIRRVPHRTRSIEIVEPRVRIPNDVLPALRDYARRKSTTVEVAAAEWLRAYAGAA